MQMGLEIRRYRRCGGSRNSEERNVGGILSCMGNVDHDFVQKKTSLYEH